MKTEATKDANYSAAQEQIIRDFKGTGPDGRLTFEDAEAIGNLPGMEDADGKARKARSITAKINRMELPYQKKVAVRKDGNPVESKAVLVAQIAEAAGVTFEGLDKAARGDLVKLRDFAFTAVAIAA